MTVLDRYHLMYHQGIAPARFQALYSRDDPTLANLQLQAELGPTVPLKTPLHVQDDLMAWSEIFDTMMERYLGSENVIGHGLPDWPTPSLSKMPLLDAHNITYDDPHPVIRGSGLYIERIARRRVYACVNYQDLDEETSDQQIVESALYSLSAHMRSWLRDWYNRSAFQPPESTPLSKIIERKEQIKQQLQAGMQQHKRKSG